MPLILQATEDDSCVGCIWLKDILNGSVVVLKIICAEALDKSSFFVS